MGKPDVVPSGMFGSFCNCTYTFKETGKQVKISIAALMKVMEKIPDPPQIFTMDIELVKSSFLLGNTIILSKGVAEALEEAMKETE